MKPSKTLRDCTTKPYCTHRRRISELKNAQATSKQRGFLVRSSTLYVQF